jgi:Fe-S cluster assembly iron-binding protein IscA
MMKLTITNTARTKIASYLDTSGLADPVSAVLWASDLGGKNAEWTIGLYERAKIAPKWIVVCDGIEFYVDPADHPKLDGKTLDYRDGRFCII